MDIRLVRLSKILLALTLASGAAMGSAGGLGLGVRTEGAVGGPLESLGEPAPLRGIPSTNIWREGNLLYGEATEQASNFGPFVVVDLSTNRVIYSGNEDIHTGFRNIMVDSQGNAYFSVNTTGLAKYDPRTNSVTVLNLTLDSPLRASTGVAADGWIYATTKNPESTLFKFNPATSQVVNLGPAWGYTTHMVLDPTGRYVYSMPDAHGAAFTKGAPVLQFDTQTVTWKVLAFLNDFYESRYGFRLGGTYALDIDPEGKRLFISMNARELGVDIGADGFGSPAVFVVHIPESEAPRVTRPRIAFEDVTSQAGIEGPLFNSYVHTASWGDVNNDGFVDLLVGTFFGPPTEVTTKLLLNNRGVFQDAGQSALEIEGRASGSAFVDFDNDGDVDLYVSNNTIPTQTGAAAEPSHIFRNDGGLFVDVTAGSGIEAQSSNGRQVGVLDFDGDGLLDLFIVADALRGSGPTVLLRNKGGFQFEDATALAGIPGDVHGLGLAIGDVTGNGWPDIFVAGGPSFTDTNRNYLFLANGDGTYREMDNAVIDWTRFTTGDEDWVSGGAFADLNRDGRLDLVVSHHFGTAAQGTGAPLRVYMNRGLAAGDPVFEDITSQAGLPNILSKAPHVELQDFDNDGWPDIYTSIKIDTADGAAPLIFTHEGLTGGDPRFAAPAMTNPHYYPGGPVADYNGDGRLDVFLEEFRSTYQGTAKDQGVVPSLLLRNAGAPGNWLQVKVDDGLTPQGIGAKVKIYEEGTSQLLAFREIAVGYGFSSSQPAVAHFGLGDRTRVDVVVEMPFSGPVYRKNSVPANRLVVMPNGSVETPAHQGLEATAVTDSSPSFLTKPSGASLPAHTVASTAPVVDFIPYPHPSYEGKPWSMWGGGLVASNGKFYAAAGDHLTPVKSGGTRDGNTFLYEYDPITKKLKSVGDILTASNHVAGAWGHGKVHGQINESADGYLYMTSYWGSRTGLVFDADYQGSVLLRYPLGIAGSSSSGGIPAPPVGPVLPGMSDPALDHDGDGHFEDVNGNGRLDFSDVVTLFVHLASPEVQDNPTGFDFNLNGRVDFADIVVLFGDVMG